MTCKHNWHFTAKNILRCQRCGAETGPSTPEQRVQNFTGEPVQVSALEFVTMTLEKEHLIGKPLIWAQWPTPEKGKP